MLTGTVLMTAPLLTAAQEATPDRVVDASADRVVQRVCDQLKSSPRFSVRADISYDEVLTNGLTVQYSRANQVLLERPSRLRVDSESDRGGRSMVYDGKTVTLYDQDRAVYAAFPAPDTIDATLDVAVERGVGLPLDDLMHSDPCAGLDHNVRNGYYAGRHYFDGEFMHHLIFTTDTADFQLWVENSEPPLLRKVVIDYRDRPQAPRYQALLSDWDFAPQVEAGSFSFTPPEGVRRIEFRPAGRIAGGASHE
jgi:hypothetical protein